MIIQFYLQIYCKEHNMRDLNNLVTCESREEDAMKKVRWINKISWEEITDTEDSTTHVQVSQDEKILLGRGEETSYCSMKNILKNNSFCLIQFELSL